MLPELALTDTIPDRTGQATAEEGLDADVFLRWTNEIRMQPAWRVGADKAAEYYAGNQLDPDQAGELEMKGLGELITNLIAPTVNILLGTEAKTRSDWRVIADTDDHQEVAEAQSAKLFEAERETRADRACSDAYAQQLISGIGWVEVTRDGNPFNYPYKVQPIHRREMFWDWRAKRPDLSDAKYIVRKRWYDIDEACNFFPEAADVIRAAGSGWPAFWLERAKEDVQLMHAFDAERRISLEDWEWRNLNSRTVAITEVWYRIYTKGLILELPTGPVIFDMKNMAHVTAVATGKIWPRQARYTKLRRAFFVGGHKMMDDDMGVSALPYIPFWGFREDLTGVPYGIVRSMIGPQDEVNARRRKLMWQLSAKRVVIDSDALDTRYNDFSDVAGEVARPDAVVVLNPSRKNAAGFSVDANVGLSDQQFKIMEESKQAIQEVAGVFNAQMGRESSATSGLAINSLVEQGNTGSAEINDNYRFARRLVGERLLELINEDMANTPTQTVVGEYGTKRKTIQLNVPTIDPETGLQYLENDVTKAKTKVALEDVPSTPAYRAQMQVMLAEVMKSLPPEMQAIMAPYFIESTELKDRHEIAARIKQSMGMVDPQTGEDLDPQVAALQQQLQAAQDYIQQGTQAFQQLQAQAADLQKQVADKQAELTLRGREIEINAELKHAELEIKGREADATVEAEAIRADAERTRAENDSAVKLRDIDARMMEASHTREAALLAPEPEERDEAAELAKIQKLLEPIQKQLAALAEPDKDEGKELEAIRKMIEPLQKQLADMAKEEKAEPPEVKPAPAAPAPVINVSIGGKKKVTVQRDAAGNITGAEVEEEGE